MLCSTYINIPNIININILVYCIMKSRRNLKTKQRKSRKNKSRKMRKSRKWTTAIDAAQKTLMKTGDIKKARQSLKKQALYNARKLFGSVSTI